MICDLSAPSHFLNQYWHITGDAMSHPYIPALAYVSSRIYDHGATLRDLHNERTTIFNPFNTQTHGMKHVTSLPTPQLLLCAQY